LPLALFLPPSVTPGDGFYAEVAVMQCEGSSECRRLALDVDAIVAELRAMSSTGERLVGNGVSGAVDWAR
jgi:hypothetical protein